jgi:site-specific DNA-cytosine methylase
MQVKGGLVQARIQTGNAVPPLLAQALAEAISSALKKKK